MDKWKARWEQGMIGWHNDHVNPHLEKNSSILFEKIETPRILIPLCGKSVDISWLAQRAQEVVGIELVQRAIELFYTEQGYSAEKLERNGLQLYSYKNTQLIYSNIFDVTKEKINHFDAIYDRAALVALPVAQRQKYADLTLSLLKNDGRILLITYDTHRPETQGPPFPIKEGIIPTLYQKASECTLIEEIMTYKEESPRLQKRNLEWSKTSIWKIIK